MIESVIHISNYGYVIKIVAASKKKDMGVDVGFDSERMYTAVSMS